MNRRRNCLKRKKNTLIGFYEINKPLWPSDSKFKDKEEKGATGDEMVKLFDQTYSADFLEKTFHTLRTAFIREHKKIAAGQDPINKKWKFYEKLEFLKEEIDKPKKRQCNVDERELLIDFFKSHPLLWNHNTTDYRDRNLRDPLLEKLVDEFDNKFKKEDIKQEWHSLQVSYKREKAIKEKKDQRLLHQAVQRSTIPHGNILTKWNFSMILQTLTNLALRLIVNLMFPHQKKRRRKKRKKIRHGLIF